MSSTALVVVTAGVCLALLRVYQAHRTRQHRPALSRLEMHSLTLATFAMIALAGQMVVLVHTGSSSSTQLWAATATGIAAVVLTLAWFVSPAIDNHCRKGRPRPSRGE